MARGAMQAALVPGLVIPPSTNPTNSEVASREPTPGLLVTMNI